MEISAQQTQCNIFHLPPETLVHIFSYFDFRDLIRCCKVCRRFYDIHFDDLLWKRFCYQNFLEETCPENVSWRSFFKKLYIKDGKYLPIYKQIKRAWRTIENYIETNVPLLKNSLAGPAGEKELAEAEEYIGCPLPKDLRCSLSFHNGESLTEYLGVLGMVQIADHAVCEKLLPLASIKMSYAERGMLRGCCQITDCSRSNVCQYLVISDKCDLPVSTIFYHVHYVQRGNVFISANSYLRWLTQFAETLQNGRFSIIDNKMYRFYHEPGTVAVTDNMFSVKVSTCFHPELSMISMTSPPEFFFTYRITMSMFEDAPKSKSCQLISRHWISTDENGIEDRISGPGVVGKYPIMRPGVEFSWVSCVTFNTTYGNMVGFFTMLIYATDELIRIQCPRFHMKCLPYITEEERKKRL
ncbi:F-box only protein 3 [Octopus sinensis]|uniref:F-box only protein 3 n=1 Tax=Octopus sinensis TaxID=2607531 RepID=A0A6P7TGX5_9MOLL|nr:F-box only protein 3 [Octopus sinensis]